MDSIYAGIRAFQKQVYPEKAELFQELAGGQKPGLLLITCSDSRIDPALITQTEPGEVFVIRNAGNIVPPWGEGTASGEAGTIEYAIEALGVQHIAVCGHSHCGAMAAVRNPSSAEGLPAVSSWLRFGEPALHEDAELGEFPRRPPADGRGEYEGPARAPPQPPERGAGRGRGPRAAPRLGLPLRDRRPVDR